MPDVDRSFDPSVFENASLYDLMLHLSVSARLDDVLKRALYATMGVFGVGEGLILLARDDHLEVTVGRLSGLEPVGHVVRFPGQVRWHELLDRSPHTLEELRSRDPDGAFLCEINRAFPRFVVRAVCPLLVQEHSLGVMLLGDKLSQEPFTTENLRFLTAMSNAVSLIVRNAEALKAMEESSQSLNRRLFELTLLYYVSCSLPPLGTPEEVVEAVLDFSLRGVAAEAAFIHWVNLPRRSLEWAACRGELGLAPSPLELGAGVVGRVALSLEAAKGSAVHSVDPALLGLAPGHGIRNYLSVPLTVGSASLAVLTVVNRKDEPLFTDSDQQLLITLANHCAQVLQNRRLLRMATEDGLTGLFVRRYFEMQLRRELSRSLRHGHPLSIIIADIDHFKRINDTYGHPAGDGVLRSTSLLLRQCLRESDVPARIGGEELAAILPETDLKGAVCAAERIRAAVEQQRVVHEHHEIRVTLSLGVCQAVGPSGGPVGPEELERRVTLLIQQADASLYRAKTGGRNRVVARTEDDPRRDPASAA